MAAITFDAAHQKEQARKQLETALAAYRAMLGMFVSTQAAAEAEHARPRQTPGSPAKNAE
jgi:outer membrane protein TolC